jgi:DNA-binding CsgD family transcriptional regulator
MAPEASQAMASPDYRQLLAVIDRLYAAALNPRDESQNFLVSLAGLFDAQNAFICEVEQRRRALDYVGLPQPNRDRVPVKRYETLIDEDPRTVSFRAHQSQAVHCRMGLSSERLHSSRAYRDYLRPLDIEYTMVVLLPIREGVTHDLGLTRGRAGQAFDAQDCELLDALAPHLARGLAIRRAITAASSPRCAIERMPEATVEQLQQLLGLSPAQAQLASSLFEGLPLRDAAERQGLTEGSARQYLQRIFEKTGTRRQTDLIRQIARVIIQ